MAMIQVSEAAVDAVLEKAKQSGMEDFAADFMAGLRLENKELHSALDGLLNSYIQTIMPFVWRCICNIRIPNTSKEFITDHLIIKTNI